MTPWIAAGQVSLSFTISQSLLKLISIESIMASNHLVFCHPFSSRPQSFPASGSFPMCQLFTSGGQRFGSISPSNEHPGLISFRMDWLDPLAVQGTLRSLLQHHSSKASILWHSAFFIVQLSHPYMTTGKTIASTRWTFVDKVMSLLFNMLSAAALLQSCPTLCDPIDGSPPDFSSLGFSRQEHWSGLPFPPPMHESEK